LGLALFDNHGRVTRSNPIPSTQRPAWLCDSGQTERDVPAEIQGKVLTIAAGAYHNLALLTDGRVVASGGDLFGRSAAPPRWG
jgi:alpha-tubulin suppressor-like RCC1 family protein